MLQHSHYHCDFTTLLLLLLYFSLLNTIFFSSERNSGQKFRKPHFIPTRRPQPTLVYHTYCVTCGNTITLSLVPVIVTTLFTLQYIIFLYVFIFLLYRLKVLPPYYIMLNTLYLLSYYNLVFALVLLAYNAVYRENQILKNHMLHI